jgi:hypothetical protein
MEDPNATPRSAARADARAISKKLIDFCKYSPGLGLELLLEMRARVNGASVAGIGPGFARGRSPRAVPTSALRKLGRQWLRHAVVRATVAVDLHGCLRHLPG